MTREVLLIACLVGVPLTPTTAGARPGAPSGKAAGPAAKAPAASVQLRTLRPVLQLRPAPEKKAQPAPARPSTSRFARLRQAIRQAPRKLLQRIRQTVARPAVAKATPCSSGACKPAARARGADVRLVARVRPMSRTVYIRRSRQVLSRLRGRDRISAFRMLASRQVRTSAAAQHAVLNYLRLRGMNGGEALPISMTDFSAMVRAKGWSARRMANFALVLRQASIIARRERLGAKQAFDKALQINGIYKKYYNGRCGA